MAILVPLEESRVEGHHFPLVRKPQRYAACLAVLVLVSAIGALTPTIFSRPSADAIDSPDDLGVTASAAPVTFRDGDGGPFSETDDTYISSGVPDTNFGASSKLLVDGAGCKISATAKCKTLIEFPDFIGPESGQVPAGSAIVSASLDLVITNKGWTQDVYQVTQSWSETAATWNSFSPAGTPETKPRDSVISPRSLGLFSINITSIVQAWVDGEPNEGLLLASDHSDGVDYESSESPNPPTLTVQFVPPSSPPAGYTIVDLGTLPGDAYSGAVRLNEAGQVVGWSVTESCYPYTQCQGRHGFLWHDGSMTNLGSLGSGTMATDINEAGQVVGWSVNSSNYERAFLWENGVMTDLGVGNSSSEAMAINDLGQVAGLYGVYTGNPPYGWEVHVFLWENGVTTDLGRVADADPGSPRVMHVTGLNNNGQIVGWSESFELHACDARAWLWQNGAFLDLTNTSGCLAMTQSIAYDMNEAGQIAAWRGSTYEGPNRAYLWENGTWTALLPPDTEGSASGINNLGQIVGVGAVYPNSAGGPFISESDRTITLLPNGFPPAFSSGANDLNDAGDVVGSAVPDGSYSGQHAVMWTTAAPPSGSATLTFQKGDGGAYSETDDTYISSGRPDTNYGVGGAMFVDASGCKVSAATVCKALIKFPSFIGSNVGQVKPGSVIVSAVLQIEITNPGGTQLLCQLTEDWTELGATWNRFTIPGSPGTKGTCLSFSAPLGVITLNITAIVQNWVNGDANYGLLIGSNSTDGVDYRSSESTNPPKLTVTFRSP